MARLFKVNHHTDLHNAGTLYIMAIVIVMEKNLVLYTYSTKL